MRLQRGDRVRVQLPECEPTTGTVIWRYVGRDGRDRLLVHHDRVDFRDMAYLEEELERAEKEK